MELPRNGDRVIITAEYLANMFPIDNIRLYLYLLAPFTEEHPEDAHCFFREMIADTKAEEDQPGKQGAIEIWEHLFRAYKNLSVFERNRIKNDLPEAIANRLNLNSA